MRPNAYTLYAEMTRAWVNAYIIAKMLNEMIGLLVEYSVSIQYMCNDCDDLAQIVKFLISRFEARIMEVIHPLREHVNGVHTSTNHWDRIDGHWPVKEIISDLGMLSERIGTLKSDDEVMRVFKLGSKKQDLLIAPAIRVMGDILRWDSHIIGVKARLEMCMQGFRAENNENA